MLVGLAIHLAFFIFNAYVPQQLPKANPAAALPAAKLMLGIDFNKTNVIETLPQ